MFTTDEAQRIDALRDTLTDIHGRFTQAFIVESVAKTGDVNLYNLGKVSEALVAAETALFRVLNTGSAYLHDEACEVALSREEVAEVAS